jgi:hypothetical protein
MVSQSLVGVPFELASLEHGQLEHGDLALTVAQVARESHGRAEGLRRGTDTRTDQHGVEGSHQPTLGVGRRQAGRICRPGTFDDGAIELEALRV